MVEKIVNRDGEDDVFLAVAFFLPLCCWPVVTSNLMYGKQADGGGQAPASTGRRRCRSFDGDGEREREKESSIAKESGRFFF
ncbi:hypothetical protein LXL04_000094 [Taraxacum kok-saghyz]